MVFFRRYFAPINLQDADRVHNEKERYVPFSAPPFREGDDQHQKQADRDRLVKAADQGAAHKVVAVKAEGETERHPEWLELSGDLAWTATFASLTSAVHITDGSTIANYTAFFALTWHLWATQAVYDINYYSNDWFHRGAFAFQLVGYASLSAFSANFKVMWGVNDASPPVDVTNSTAALIAQASENHHLNGMKASFLGVNAILVINRFALLVQYTRILWYRRKYRKLSWGSLAIPVSLLVAIIIFASCFILVSVAERTRAAAVVQVGLWSFAVAIQILGQFLTPDERQDALFEDTDITPRMATLTVIILGEGLNGICQVLQHSVNSLGLTKSTIGVGFSLAIVLYFIWLLYFDGYRSVRRPSKPLLDSWLWLHALFHLLLILTLQGLKNAFLSNSVVSGTRTFDKHFNEQIDIMHGNNGRFAPSQEMTDLLEKMSMSWDLEIQQFNTAMNISLDAAYAEMWRYYGTGLHNIIQTYVEEPDGDGEALYQTFMALNDTILSADFQNPVAPLLQDWYGKLLGPISGTSVLALDLAGGVFIFLGLLNALQRFHRDRFATTYILIRLLAGVFLLMCGVASPLWISLDPGNVSIFIRWIIPIIAIVAAVSGILDQLTLRLSVRSIRKQEALIRVPTGSPEEEKYAEAKVQAWDKLAPIWSARQRTFRRGEISSLARLEDGISLPELHSNGRTEAIEMTEGKQRYNEGLGLRLRGERQ